MSGALPPVVDRSELTDETVIADVRWYLDGRSGLDAYLAGHVPGAIWVDLDAHLAASPSVAEGRHPLPSAAAFAASLSELGIGPTDTVVAYDDLGGMVAGRLVWMLRVVGQPAALLDGGLAAFEGSLETTARTRPPVVTPPRPWPADAVVSADDVAALGPDRVLVDARAPERYRGEVEPVDSRAGHIPGALNVPFAANLDAAGRFLDGDELRTMYGAAGVTDGAATVVYCGSGVSACHDILAMERAGLGRPSLYPGSWSQWSGDPDRPAARDDA